jgi:hypothetical protein
MNIDKVTEPACSAPPMVANTEPMKMDLFRPRFSASHDAASAPRTDKKIISSSYFKSHFNWNYSRPPAT